MHVLDSEELDFAISGMYLRPDDFNPGAPGEVSAPPQPGLLRRLWRKLTGK